MTQGQGLSPGFVTGVVEPEAFDDVSMDPWIGAIAKICWMVVLQTRGHNPDLLSVGPRHCGGL